MDLASVSSPTSLSNHPPASLLHHLTDTGNVAHFERRQKLRFLRGQYPEHPIGLGLSGTDFGNQPRRANANRAVQLRRGLHLFMQSMRRAQWEPMQTLGARHVEIGFVD